MNKRWNENELNKLDAEERRLASALFKTTLSVLGGSLHKMLSLGDNYFDVGGNSLNAVIVVTKLRDQGFHLGSRPIHSTFLHSFKRSILCLQICTISWPLKTSKTLWSR
jgi:hypothetical protein